MGSKGINSQHFSSLITIGGVYNIRNGDGKWKEQQQQHSRENSVSTERISEHCVRKLLTLFYSTPGLNIFASVRSLSKINNKIQNRPNQKKRKENEYQSAFFPNLQFISRLLWLFAKPNDYLVNRKSIFLKYAYTHIKMMMVAFVHMNDNKKKQFLSMFCYLRNSISFAFVAFYLYALYLFE